MVTKSRSARLAAALLLTWITTTPYFGAAEASGVQLAASWVDNSNGTATTRLERRLGTGTAFTAIADVAAGVTEYVDASVASGTTYCYRVLAYDASGVSPYSDEACATSATTPPPPAGLTLSFTNPASGATVSGIATVSLSASGGSGYTFTVKADGATIYTGTNGTFSWNTTAVANGSHTLTATVTDSESRVGTASQTVTVSNAPEAGFTVTFTSPASGATVSGSQSVGLSTTAASGQAKTFALFVDGTALTSPRVSAGTTVSYSWDTTTVGNGARTLTATVTVAGQTATTTLPVTVSNDAGTPLTAAFTAPTAGASVAGLTTIGMAAAGASGTSTFKLAVDGTVVSTQTVAASTASYAWNTTGAGQGSRTLTLTVTDAAARTATATLDVTVNATSASTGPCSAPGQPVLNVPATYSSIQAAVSAASNGSCILVAPGTYGANVLINGKYVELKASAADPAQTVLDGGQVGAVVVFQNVPYDPTIPYLPVARISGFTIQNGRSVPGQAGGITLANQADVVVTNNIIRNNVGGVDGGGILVYNRSHATIVNNTITGNSVPRFGAGIMVNGDGSADGGSHPVISHNTISGNVATGASVAGGGASGGGILVARNSSPHIVGNVLSGNSAPFAGGAISLLDGMSGYVADNTITGNAATYGGGIHIETYGSSLAVVNNTISNNQATYSAAFQGGFGGGISVYAQSQPTILQNVNSGNTATYGGGGIVVAEGASAVIRANTISGNVVNGDPASSPIGPPPGGGIYVSQAVASIVNNVIAGNSSGFGGGIGLLGGGPTTVTIENNTIVKNVATTTAGSGTGRVGGGLFVPVNGNGTPATNTVVRNNIFDLNTGFQIFEAFSGGATYQNNLVNDFSDGMYFNYNSHAVHTIGTFNATVAGGANVSGNPGFVNAAGNDFRLTSGSAAIDQGTASGAPPDDLLNLDRPAGAGVDIGAYEFTSQTVAKSPLYRFFSRTNSVHFYTQSKGERDAVLELYPYMVWRFEGIAYQTYPTAKAQTVPIHRFFSYTYGSHFYTVSLCEMYTDCQVHPPGAPQARYPDNVWHYEGVAFYVYPTAVAGATAVYRFHSPVTGHHFYTNNEAEKNGLIANPGPAQWNFEGAAWYVPGS